MTHQFIFFVGAAFLVGYAAVANVYFLRAAMKINDEIKKSGHRMESSVFSCLSWNTNFWNEASALCEKQDLLKVLDRRTPIFVIWCFLVGSFFAFNLLSTH